MVVVATTGPFEPLSLSASSSTVYVPCCRATSGVSPVTTMWIPDELVIVQLNIVAGRTPLDLAALRITPYPSAGLT